MIRNDYGLNKVSLRSAGFQLVFCLAVERIQFLQFPTCFQVAVVHALSHQGIRSDCIFSFHSCYSLPKVISPSHKVTDSRQGQ